MATALWPFLSCVQKGTSRFMGRLVARHQSTDHCASGEVIGSSVGYSNQVYSRLHAVNDINVFLFRCHAHGADSSRAAIDTHLCELHEIACCGVLLGSDSSLWYRARAIEACQSLRPASVGMVSDEGTSDSLDSLMAVSDSTAPDRPLPRVGVLALLSGAGESAARTCRQRLVDLVTSVDRNSDYIALHNPMTLFHRFDQCTYSISWSSRIITYPNSSKYPD